MKISVIIPVYNAENYLIKCLDSVVNQSYKDWEVVAIDDGSLDQSYQKLKKYASFDKRFKVFTQENRGPGYTRNQAISRVTGEYIVFLDADDYIEKNFFSDLVQCINKYQPEIIFLDLLQEKPNGELIKIESISKYNDCSKDKLIRYQLTGKIPWGGVRKVVKTSVILENDIKYTNDVVGEEALYSFKVLYYSEKITFLNKPYYHYINHPGSQSKKGHLDPWGGVCESIGKYLEGIGKLSEYQKTLNSFGFTALVVSIYRISQTYKFSEATQLSKDALKRFEDKYSFDLDISSLEKRAKYLFPFARIGLVFPIVLLAKLKSSLSSL
jgi:glycosyltransferase involved in cell wall biosynthesis